jgi:hypothetical protein
MTKSAYRGKRKIARNVGDVIIGLGLLMMSSMRTGSLITLSLLEVVGWTRRVAVAMKNDSKDLSLRNESDMDVAHYYEGEP